MAGGTERISVRRRCIRCRRIRIGHVDETVAERARCEGCDSSDSTVILCSLDTCEGIAVLTLGGRHYCGVHGHTAPKRSG